MQVSVRQEADPAWQQLPFRATNLGGALLSWIPSRYIFSNLLPHGSNFQFADTAVDIFLFKSVFKQVKCIFNELWCCCFCHQCSLIKPVITQVTFSHLSMRICWRLQFTTSGVKSGVNQDLEEHCGNVPPLPLLAARVWYRWQDYSIKNISRNCQHLWQDFNCYLPW